jgi:hypothetical protein
MKLASLVDMWTEYPTDTKDVVATLIGGTCGDNITKYDWIPVVSLEPALNYSASAQSETGRVKSQSSIF